MATASGFIMICILLFVSKSINGVSKLKIIEISKFPVSIDKDFLIKLIPIKQSGKINENLLDALVIEISDTRYSEKAIINYGFKNIIEKEFQGQNMIIKNWQKLDDKQLLMVNITFTKLASNKMLKIYQISPSNGQERQNILKNLPKENPIYSSLITLLIPPKLDLFIRSMDGNIGELTLNQFGIAVCRAYQGEPLERPMWVNLNEFSVKSSNYTVEKNEREMHFNVSIENHLKEIHCKAGSAFKSVKIAVFHPPSEILLQPEINNFVQRDSTIVCEVLDGYPIPDVRWHFIKGPSNSSKYYTISKNGKTLHMKPDTPLGSEWIFNCTATNILPGLQGTVKRTVLFIVESKSSQVNESYNKITDKKCNNEINSLFKNEFKLHNEKLAKDCLAVQTALVKLQSDVASFMEKEQAKIVPNTQKQSNSSFEWFFESFHSQRVLYSTFPYYTSNSFVIPKRKLKLRLWFQHNVDGKFVILRFWVYVFPVSYIPIKYEHNGMDVTIEICNPINILLCKRISKSIAKNIASQNYDFLYSDLSLAGIFYGDSIVIKCFVQ